MLQEILFCGFIGSCASIFFDYCISTGGVFDFYNTFLNWLRTKSEFWAQPFGTCLPCINVYITALLFGYLNYFGIVHLQWFALIPVIFVSNLFVKLMLYLYSVKG